MVADAAQFIREEVSERVVQAHRHRRLDDLPARLEFVNLGFDFQAAELDAARSHLSKMAREGNRRAQREFSKVKLARRAGLTDWPGFDLLSRCAEGERRAIEVKGRAGTGGIELSENEWAKACNLRDEYWLYVRYAAPAFGASARPVCQAARQEPRVYRLHYQPKGCYRGRRAIA